MAINTIARKVSDLPITLLEVNVLIHVLIAVAIYALWWNKPQSVMRPKFIKPRARTSHDDSGDSENGEDGNELTYLAEPYDTNSDGFETPLRADLNNIESAEGIRRKKMRDKDYNLRVIRFLALQGLYEEFIGFKFKSFAKSTEEAEAFAQLKRETEEAEKMIVGKLAELETGRALYAEMKQRKRKAARTMDCEQKEGLVHRSVRLGAIPCEWCEEYLTGSCPARDYLLGGEFLKIDIPQHFAGQTFSVADPGYYPDSLRHEAVALRGNIYYSKLERTDGILQYFRVFGNETLKNVSPPASTKKMLENIQSVNYHGFCHHENLVHLRSKDETVDVKFWLWRRFLNEQELEELERFCQKGVDLEQAIITRKPASTSQDLKLYTPSFSLLKLSTAYFSDYYDSDPLEEPTLKRPSDKGSLSALLEGAARMLFLSFPLFLVYSIPHLLTWNAHFPTVEERFLWRASATTIACTSPATAVLYAQTLLGDAIVEKLDRARKGWFGRPTSAASDTETEDICRTSTRVGLNRWIFTLLNLFSSCAMVIFLFLIWPILYIMGLLLRYGSLTFIVLTFIFARGFIIIEAFIAVCNLPKGSFQEVELLSTYWMIIRSQRFLPGNLLLQKEIILYTGN